MKEIAAVRARRARSALLNILVRFGKPKRNEWLEVFVEAMLPQNFPVARKTDKIFRLANNKANSSLEDSVFECRLDYDLVP